MRVLSSGEISISNTYFCNCKTKLVMALNFDSVFVDLMDGADRVCEIIRVFEGNTSVNSNYHYDDQD